MPSLVHVLTPEQAQWIHQQKYYASRLYISPSDDSTQVIYPYLKSNRLTWSQQYENLKMYCQRYGDANVPRHFPDNPRLGNWVHRQRVRRRNGSKYGELNRQQIDLLDRIGFRWELRSVVSHEENSHSSGSSAS